MACEMSIHGTMNRPGLFITGTDTGVGKTVVTCAITMAMRAARPSAKVGVCKPIATGCRWVGGELVSEDAAMLAHYSDCRLPLEAINPVRYEEAMAPAVAAERTGRPVDEAAIAESLRRIGVERDAVLVEGVGGILVPIGPGRTVLDLMREIGYPVVVVCRAGLGTLNHTAMTCRLIREAGLPLAGVVINRFRGDGADLAEATNSAWIAKQNETQILATVPDVGDVAAMTGPSAALPDKIFAAVSVTDWWALCRVAKPCV